MLSFSYAQTSRHPDIWWNSGEVRPMIRVCQTGQLQTSAGSLPEVRIPGILNYFYTAFEPFLIAGISLYIYSAAYVCYIWSHPYLEASHFYPIITLITSPLLSFTFCFSLVHSPLPSLNQFSLSLLHDQIGPCLYTCCSV